MWLIAWAYAQQCTSSTQMNYRGGHSRHTCARACSTAPFDLACTPQQLAQAPAGREGLHAGHVRGVLTCCTQAAARTPASHRPTNSGHTRVGSAFSAMWCFTSLMATSCRWKMPAASAADALVPRNTSVKCEGAPAPLLAMTGMLTAELTASMSGRSKPC